jgi:hypothetical protein
MAYDTVIQQGRFTSTGTAKTLQIRSDLDWMKVYNTTVAAASQTTAIGVSYYWQRGFPAGAQWEHLKSNAANAANLDQYLTTGGFTLVDSSVQTPGTLNATITAISNASIPVVTNSGTNGLSAGDVVRIINVAGAQQLGGFDFTVGYNTLSTTTFSLDYMSAIATATTGSWRKINFDPIFYPRRRFITKITQATSAVVTLSVTHGYQVGQLVRFVVPAAYGMVEMDGLQGTITAINTTTTSGNTITVNIDSSAFTAFAFPLTAAVPFTAAEVVPVGEDTGFALSAGVDILSDATINQGFIGITLAAGANSPAGQNNDVIYWVAGKSFSVDNQ